MAPPWAPSQIWPPALLLPGCPGPGPGARALRPAFSLQGYGRAQHSISTEKIKARYPDYEVTWADDGY